MSPSPPNDNSTNTTTTSTTTTTEILDTINTTNAINASQGSNNIAPPLRLLASTLSTYQSSIAESHLREYNLLEKVDSENSSSNVHDGGRRKLPNGMVYTLGSTMKEKEEESSCFRTIEWTPDGTSLVTTGEDNVMRVFVVYVLLPTSMCLLRFLRGGDSSFITLLLSTHLPITFGISIVITRI